MKTLILSILLAASLLAADKKAERFAERFAHQQKVQRHLIEDWVAYCKGHDMVPDATVGCVAPPPKPVEPPHPAPPLKPDEKK